MGIADRQLRRTTNYRYISYILYLLMLKQQNSLQMRKILSVFFLFPILTMAQGIDVENPIRFLALGDSYTIGQSVPTNMRWPVQLSDSLAVRGIQTDTLSIIATTGWRTDNLINAIRNKDLEDKNYNLVSLLIGVNNQYQGRPFSQYVNEFPALVDSAIRYAGGDRSHVFIVSIPDYAYTPFGQQSGNPDQISEEIDQYNEYSRHVADSLQITYFDITPISQLGLVNPSYVASDGLHPSGIQYTEWVKLMLAHIDQQLTGTEPQLPPIDYSIEISPNPFQDHITIKLAEMMEPQKALIQIYTITGELMLEQYHKGGLASLMSAGWPDGIYILKVIYGRHQLVKMVLKA